MFGSLVRPNFPSAAIGFGNETVSAVSLQKEGRNRFGIKRAATSEIPDGVLIPSFDDINIPDEFELVNILQGLVTEGGLAGRKKWSAALPANSARTVIITLEETPASKTELNEVLDWKTETAFGVPAATLRVSRQKITPSVNGKARYFVTGLKLSVLDEYESIFSSMGWHVGLILPRAVGESSWFSRSSGDSLLISAQNDGFTALLVRDREPVVVRSVTCGETELDDEIYRLLVYYQDRVAREGGDGHLSRLMVLGDGLNKERVNLITAEAMGEPIGVVVPDDLGFNIPVGNLRFQDLAAPAGLATLGWD